MHTNLVRSFIIKKVFTKKNDKGSQDSESWIFDFKKILLNPFFLNLISDIFSKEIVKIKKNIQICGLETSSIPIIAGIIMKSPKKNPGFFIRKSRKKTGLMNMIEGEVNDSPIVIVDDILNSGASVLRQIEALEQIGKKVSYVFSILRFRDISFYSFLTEKGIKIYSIFTLEDFKNELGDLVLKKTALLKPFKLPFKTLWVFKNGEANYGIVAPKSSPLFHNNRLFFGTDNGNFYCLDSKTGDTLWTHKTLFGSKKKFILSSPCVYGDTIFFGAYDGNFYALDIYSGEKKWVFLEADWVGSSPCVSIKNKLVYIGLEFGVWNKKGGIAAIDVKTGLKKWQYYEMEGLTHSSPAVSDKDNVVVCGCNDNFVYAFNSKTGELLWKYKTSGEIKASFCFDEEKGIVFFGSFDHFIYALRIKTGQLVWKFETLESIYSTPLLYKNTIYVASLDKILYCLNSNTGKKRWEFATSARIFSSPEVVKNEICIGSNDSRLYLLNPNTGENTSICQVTERITNRVAYDKEQDIIFLPTFANELYAITKDK